MAGLKIDKTTLSLAVGVFIALMLNLLAAIYLIRRGDSRSS